MIEFRQVTKRYDSDHTALRQVNFHLDRGELAFLTGHSGAGKSTLLKLIMVMERPTAGEVVVGGQRLNSLPKRQIPYIRRHIGVVFQNHQLLFDRTVFDNVALPGRWSISPPCCWRMSQPVTWIQSCPPISCSCSRSSVRSGLPC